MTAPSKPSAFGGVFAGKSVLVTGHTGFKGSWLCEWLLALGADVTGLGLEPDTTPALFSQLRLEERIRHVLGDVRSGSAVGDLVSRLRPDFVFHLAAQSLVRRSYQKPVYTWETNVLGTVHVLDALRALDSPCAAVIVTTDKCYENREWEFGYREIDPLGGRDPYSSSKAAAELAVASWRRSFHPGAHPTRIASARAGNVIGGGDWAEDRIVPDAIRALSRAEPIHVRNPSATRPWQHVLEPLSGYLALAAALATDRDDSRLDAAFNIGPDHDANCSVERLVETALAHWPGTWTTTGATDAPHEAGLLHLDNARIRAVLGWRPVWLFPEAVSRAINWYRDVVGGTACEAPSRTRADIDAYESAAKLAGIPWACGAATLRR